MSKLRAKELQQLELFLTKTPAKSKSLHFKNDSYSTLGQYLEQIGQRRFLTPEEEQQKFQELGKYRDTLYGSLNYLAPDFIDTTFPEFRKYEEADSNRWRFLNDISRMYLSEIKARQEYSSPREYKKLEKQKQSIAKPYSKWNNLRNELIERNLGLVVFASKIFKVGKISREDRISDGNLGLSRAVDSFEVERGNKFSYYAFFWIKEAMNRRFVDTCMEIRIPAEIYKAAIQIKDVERERSMVLEREEISDTEIAAELLRRARKKAKKEGKALDTSQVLDAAKIGNIRAGTYAVTKVASLEVEVKSESGYGSQTLLDALVDPAASNPGEEAAGQEYVRTVSAELERILVDDPRELAIIRLRKGMGYKKSYELKEIGAMFNISYERVRQLESKALERLRNSAVLAELWAD